MWHVPRPTTEGHSGAGVHVLVAQQLHFIWKPCHPVAVDWCQRGLPGSALFSRGTDAYLSVCHPLSVWCLLMLTDNRVLVLENFSSPRAGGRGSLRNTV